VVARSRKKVSTSFYRQTRLQAKRAALSSTRAVSIYASSDGLTTAVNIEASKASMPATTCWVEVAGSKRVQFGWYGVQEGDG